MDIRILNYEIRILKEQLQNTDYQAIKYAEGQITDEEYEPIKTSRQECRIRINELEKEVRKIENNEIQN